VLPGLVGTIQATETLKLILGIGDTLVGRLLLVDTLGMRFHMVRIPRDPNCPACGTHEITELVDYETFCGMPGGMMAKDSANNGINEITPRELAQRLAAHDDFTLIDVREPYEWQIGRIEGARLIPLGEIPDAMSTLDPAKEIVVYCRSGKRSADAVRQLTAAGFNATNVAGGILRWSDEVDPTIPKY
jgi:sulfur-carrier protein adenylyltransferase/sulfurtransferase